MTNSIRKRTSVSRLLNMVRPVVWVLAFAFAFVCVCTAPFSCSAQSGNCISVRALDYKKGTPVKNVSVTVDAKTVKTDSIGIAKFCLTDPISANLGLSLDGEHFESCSGYTFETATIQKIGYLARASQCHGEPTFRLTENPKPGELAILVRHIGWLERNIDWP